MRSSKPLRKADSTTTASTASDRRINAGTVLVPIAGSRWDEPTAQYIVCFVEPAVLYCINEKGWGCLIEANHAEMLEDSGQRAKVMKGSYKLFGKTKGWEA